MFPLANSRRRVVLLAVGIALVPASSRAATLLSRAKACAAKIVGDEYCNEDLGTDSAQAEAQFSAALSDGLHSHAGVDAEAAYGSLSGFGAYDASGVQSDNFGVYTFDGHAAFDDALTVSGGTGSGKAMITFHLSGSVRNGCNTVKACISPLPVADAETGFAFYGGAADGGPTVNFTLQAGQGLPPASDIGTDLVTGFIPFTFGQAFNVYGDLRMTAAATFDFPNPNDPPGANFARTRHGHRRAREDRALR